MNDNDIIKALECCTEEPVLNCRKCPYEKSCNMGRSDMQKDALALINRLKAENRALKSENDKLKHEMSYMKSPNTIGDTHEMGAW